MGYIRFGCVGNDHIVSHLLFLLIFISYHLLLLVVQSEKERMAEKRQGYFQTQLLFPGLPLFRGEKCFSRTSKIAVLPVDVSIDMRRSFLLAPGSPCFLALPFLSEAYGVSRYFMLLLLSDSILGYSVLTPSYLAGLTS